MRTRGRARREIFSSFPQKKKAGRTLPSLDLEAGYFLSILSIFLSAFFFLSDLAFFSFFSIFFSDFFSSFICAPACEAAKAEALTTANIAATITDSSLFISFSCFVFEHGWTQNPRYPGLTTRHRKPG